MNNRNILFLSLCVCVCACVCWCADVQDVLRTSIEPPHRGHLDNNTQVVVTSIDHGGRYPSLLGRTATL